jgi:hypothetical protein
MTNPIDTPDQRFRVELPGGAVVEADEQWPAADDRPAMMAVRLPAARAHALAHLLGEWSTSFRMAPDQGQEPSTFTLSRALEDVAAAMGDPAALVCATRAGGSVPTERRLAAVEVLRADEPSLSMVQRVAVVDAAARWLDEDAGDELAFALLGAVCVSAAVTMRTYLALIAPTPDDLRDR